MFDFDEEQQKSIFDNDDFDKTDLKVTGVMDEEEELNPMDLTFTSDMSEDDEPTN